MDDVTLVTPFQGVRRLTIDIAYNHTKFDEAIPKSFRRYFRGSEILKLAT